MTHIQTEEVDVDQDSRRQLYRRAAFLCSPHVVAAADIAFKLRYLLILAGRRASDQGLTGSSSADRCASYQSPLINLRTFLLTCRLQYCPGWPETVPNLRLGS